MDNNKKPICFVTNCSDEYYYSMGAEKLVKSARYFHPDIPFHVLGTEDMNALGGHNSFSMAPVINKFIDEYEWVVRLDADSMMSGPLDELLHEIAHNGTADIISVRNNNNKGKAGADEPISQPGAGTEHYLNAGLIATRSKDFLTDWMEHNFYYGEMLPFAEQSTFNALAQKYKTLIIDAPATDVHYGVSGLYGSGEEGQSHWDSWKDIMVIKGELFLRDKKVKVIHHAGGFSPNKLGLYMFNEQTRKRLEEILK